MKESYRTWLMDRVIWMVAQMIGVPTNNEVTEMREVVKNG